MDAKDWIAIKSLIINYINNLMNSLKNKGFIPPEWDATDISSQATTEAKMELDNQDFISMQKAIDLTFEKAYGLMVGFLNWEEIQKTLLPYIKHLLHDRYGQSYDQVDEQANDIADEVYLIAHKNWTPDKETHWELAGLKFAEGVARKLVLEVGRNNRKKKSLVQDNDISDMPDPSNIVMNSVDKKALVKVVDEWLSKQTSGEATAFSLELIYGVDQITCGLICEAIDNAYMSNPAKKRTDNGYRNFWEEKSKEMHKSLQDYLDDNEGKFRI